MRTPFSSIFTNFDTDNKEIESYASEYRANELTLYLKEKASRGIWVNQYGTEMPVSGLSLDHLNNIARMLREGRAPNRLCFTGVIQNEINRRKKILNRDK